MADIKESSSIEQYATNVLVLHRENRESTDAILFVDKARNGQIGDIDLKFEKKTTTFFEPSKFITNF